MQQGIESVAALCQNINHQRKNVVTKNKGSRSKKRVKLLRYVKSFIVKNEVVPKSNCCRSSNFFQSPRCGFLFDTAKINLRFSVGDIVQVNTQQQRKVVWMRDSVIDLWCRAPEPSGWAACEFKLDFKLDSDKRIAFVEFDPEHVVRSELMQNGSF